MRGRADDTVRPDGTEVAAVETLWMRGENKKFARLQGQATMPNRHRPPIAVVAKRKRREPATDEDVSPEPAHAVSRNCGNRLQKIGGTREIGPALGQGSNRTSEINERKVTDT